MKKPYLNLIDRFFIKNKTLSGSIRFVQCKANRLSRAIFGKRYTLQYISNRQIWPPPPESFRKHKYIHQPTIDLTGLPPGYDIENRETFTRSDVDFLLNVAVGKAMIGTKRIVHPDSNKIADWVIRFMDGKIY